LNKAGFTWADQSSEATSIGHSSLKKGCLTKQRMEAVLPDYNLKFFDWKIKKKI
jgi:hypothetical protein